MATDFTSNPADDPINNESETPMFAPIPAWERGKKRRGFGSGRTSRVAPEPRTFTADGPEAAAAAPVAAAAGGAMAAEDLRPYETTRYDTAGPADTSFAAAPAYAGAARPRSGSRAPLAVAAGIIILGGLAAAGWYYTQSRSQGVAELTPGGAATATTTTDTAQATPPAEAAQAATPSQMAQTTAPPSASRTTTRTTRTHTELATAAPRHSASRASAERRAAAASDDDVGVNASTTAAIRSQASPAPVTSAPPAAATAPPVLNVPPAPSSASASTSSAPTISAPPAATQTAPQAPATPPSV
jgi:hypothetical protein